ncbi:hypothetical protein ACZ87_03447 [Candidatus Erwinia dacicola]|uniref:Uncharacterized protein n=1 Tax=Candidatus Erwinia dacicola TaxID=252393 RepID=A0A328TGW6_9GAMM|nr:hypothetical protein ACZ87_03447 [Candidatus Erwinia dacicola]
MVAITMKKKRFTLSRLNRWNYTVTPFAGYGLHILLLYHLPSRLQHAEA